MLPLAGCPLRMLLLIARSASSSNRGLFARSDVAVILSQPTYQFTGFPQDAAALLLSKSRWCGMAICEATKRRRSVEGAAEGTDWQLACWSPFCLIAHRRLYRLCPTVDTLSLCSLSLWIDESQDNAMDCQPFCSSYLPLSNSAPTPH